DRHEELRLYEGLNDLELLLRRMTADVNVGDPAVQHSGAETKEIIDGAVNERLVPGKRRGGQDNGVAGHDLDVLVVAVCHSGQRGRRLALAAGSDNGNLLRSRAAKVIDIQSHFAREVKVAVLSSHLNVVEHAPAGDEDFPPTDSRGIDNVLITRDPG